MLSQTRRLGQAIVFATVVALALQQHAAMAGQGSVLEVEVPEYHASFGNQYVPDVAYGDGVYCSAWTDLRVGAAAGGGYDLFAQLVRTDGTIVFEGSLVMQRDRDKITGYPRVAWNGSTFLVVWGEPSGAGRYVKALRVTSNGTILDAEPIIVHLGGQTGISYDVASDGDQFLVAYAVPNAGVAAVEAVRVAADGTVIDKNPLIIRPAGGSPFWLQHPRLAFGGGLYVLVYLENERTRAARITPSGEVLDPGGVQFTPFASLWADVASDGINFLVTWTELTDPSVPNAGAGILDTTTMTMAQYHDLTDADFDGAVNPGSIEFDGSRYLVTIYKPEPTNSLIRDLYGVFADTTGAPVSSVFPIEVRQGADQGPGGLAYDGVNYFAAWEDSRAAGYAIFGKFIASDGSPVGLQATLLSPSASWQIASSTAFDGENYLVVWEDWRKGPDNAYKSDLYAARMTPEGFVLDDPAFLIADRPNREMMPQMIFDGQQYFVVFEYGGYDSKTIRGARILPDGTVLDPDGFDIAHSHPNGSVIRPQVAFNGRKYLVVWYNNYGTSGTTGVMGALVDTDGTVSSPTPIGIATQSFVGNTSFHVESNGDEFLVSWTVVNNNNSMSMKVTRVSDSGQILGTATLESSPFTIGYSRIAFNGESYFVTWKQGIGANVTAYGTRVGTDGQPIGDVITVATGTHGYWDVVAHRGTFVLPFAVDAGAASGLYVTQLDGDGSVLVDRRRVQDVPFRDLFGDASIASGPWDSLFIASTLWADMPFNAPRIWKIPVALNGTAVPGDSDADGDVDLADFSAFLDCVSGPGGGVPVDCGTSDIDADDDVDFADLGALQLSFTGGP